MVRPVRTWFLTYSQVPEGLTKELILAHLLSLQAEAGKLEEHVVAEERHQDGGKHIHVHAKYEKGVTKAKLLCFDYTHLDELIHGNYQATRTPLAVVKYCTKEGDEANYLTNIVNLTDYGKSKTKKLRLEILEIGAAKSLEQALIHPKDYWALRRSLAAYHLDTHQQPKHEEPRGMWLTGPTGAGKTHYVVNTYASLHEVEVYSKEPNKWWDGYTGQRLILIDDLRPADTKYIVSKLKKWLDKWAIGVYETKGGHIHVDYDYFVITSQYTIEECFDDPRDAAAIRRRCTYGVLQATDKQGEFVTQTPVNSYAAPNGDYSSSFRPAPWPAVVHTCATSTCN